jgi:hypothetical protein
VLFTQRLEEKKKASEEEKKKLVNVSERKKKLHDFQRIYSFQLIITFSNQ